MRRAGGGGRGAGDLRSNPTWRRMDRVGVVRSVTMEGHDQELAELLAIWRDVVAARSGALVRGRGAGPTAIGRTALITGPTGAGKSRLVTAALESLEPEPASIHIGTARVHSPAPYDWLAALLSQHDDLDVPVPPAALAWLRQDPDVPADRYAPDALLRIAVRLVRALVGRGPAVLVVEDLHALDPASLNLVAEIGAAPDLPVLLIVTSRPTSAPLHASTIARLAGTAGAIREHLGALDRAGVAAALAEAYRESPERVIDAVLARTGGDPARLPDLLRAAAPNPAAPDPAATDRATPNPADLDPAAAADLTARELDVLRCVAEGMSNQQIATRLSISVRTVAVHMSNLLRKTHSRSRTDAALWAVRHSLSRAPVEEPSR